MNNEQPNLISSEGVSIFKQQMISVYLSIHQRCFQFLVSKLNENTTIFSNFIICSVEVTSFENIIKIYCNLYYKYDKLKL